jgi:TPR repeat protein
MSQGLITAVLLLLAGLSGPSALAATEAWVEVKSPAFTVASDGTEKEARRVALQFERVRAFIKEVWPWANVDSARPVTILAVRNESGLKRLLPAYWDAKGGVHPAGLFAKAPDRSWVALRMDVARFREADAMWDNPYLVVFHEYVHLVLHLNFDALPLWLDEGLAEFWGNAIIEDDRIYEGLPVPYHILTLRERAPMRLSTLMAVRHGSPEYSENNRATIFYAQSWALVHYLAVGSDGRRGQLNQFVTLLKNGKGQDEAARQAFGDPSALDRELQEYVRRRAFRYRRRMTSLQLAGETWPGRTLPAAESLALQAGFHGALGRAGEARRLAGEAIALEPKTTAAYEALGLLALRENQKQEAREMLAKAVALAGASDYACLLYGHLLWESLSGTEGLDAVEASFQRAVDTNASFADAYEALARVMAARGAPLEKTLPLALRAVQLEPGVIDHRIVALRLTAGSGDVQGARELAQQLATRVQGDDRARVEALVKELADPRRLSPEDACAAGVASACAELGGRHRDGLERPRDPAKSAAYFEKACAGGDASSCAAFGWALERGDGVAQDLPRAIPLFRKACEGGDRWSCTRLAFALVSGRGVAADPAAAAPLFEGACRSGDQPACANLGAMLRTGHGVAKDEARAETLLADACEHASAWACGELGLLFAARGSAASLSRAVSLFEKACEAGVAASCAALAGLTAAGQGTARDPARAHALFQKACQGGYAEACPRGANPR